MRLIAAIGCAALVSFLSPAARAQSADDQEAAKAHFLAGSAYYEQANYNDAVKEFNEAHRLSQRPDLLYNIALCYERLEQYDKAIAALKQYLSEKQNAPDGNVIQERIQNLEKRRTVTTVTVSATPPKKFRHTASLVVGSVGVAVLAAALGTGLAADQIHKDLDRACPNSLCVDSSLRSKRDQGYDLAVASDVLLGVGLAALATGVVLLIVELKRPPRAAARLAPAGGGLQVSF
ncbi:MAG TPA: CDC27 family protein [Polyangia bacterium]|nr:CDC27 family protein [Polyangia bacterium]